MKHFVVGYDTVTRKGAVTVLYAGDSRADARDALFAGAPGIVVTDYLCNPQVSQSKRHPAAVVTPPAAVPPPEPKPPVKAEPKPEAKAEAPQKSLALPPKSPATTHAPPDSES